MLCFLIATLLLWLVPLLSMGDTRQTNRRLWSGAIGSGAIALLVAAALIRSSGSASFAIPRPFFLGSVPLSFRTDGLSSWFLLTIAAVTFPLALYLPSYVNHMRGKVDLRLFWSALGLLLISMAAVVLSANALVFLVAWELMSVSSFALVATDHSDAHARQAAMVYLGATRVGTAFLAGGMLWAHALVHSWEFRDWCLTGAPALGPGLLLLLGLGVKAGMWPFHLWLPIAHPAAPAPVSALMSGVMVKVAIYMIVRLYVLPGPLAHPVFGGILLTLGAISAFWGVLFALLQHDLKRLLAYHTVENVGLILMGIGLALVARDHLRHEGMWISRIALAAALFHVLNHAIFKSLLFLGAGAVDSSAGTRDLEHLGGLGRRMPVTFACFALGSAAICALPPLNGFASEWLLYQSLLGVAGSEATPGLRFAAMLLIGWIALVGVLAAACFVKATGAAFLGRPRSHKAEQASEAPQGMLAAQILYGTLCVALGLLAPVVLATLQPIVSPLESGGMPLALAWTLPTASLVIVLAATAGAVALWSSCASRRLPSRTYHTWECGFGPLTPRMQMTATSFAQPIARLFGALYNYAMHLHIEGTDRRLFPEEIRAEHRTEAMLESRVYLPLIALVNRAGDLVARMQAGSIHFYLLTMFATLFALLAIGRLAR